MTKTKDETRDANVTIMEKDDSLSTHMSDISIEFKENRLKRAMHQLAFMNDVNNQVNTRSMHEIESRQQTISVKSLICSIPFFNSLSAKAIRTLIDACRTQQLDSKSTVHLACVKGEEQLYIIANGSSYILPKSFTEVAKVEKENLPVRKVGVGDFMLTQSGSSHKLVAIEPSECLILSLKKIAEVDSGLKTEIFNSCNFQRKLKTEFESFTSWSQALSSLLYKERDNADVYKHPFSKHTLKAFHRGLLLQISPEHEVNSAVDKIRSLLIHEFGARSARLYAIDRNKNRYFMKSGEDGLPISAIPLDQSIAQKVLETKKGCFILDPLQSTTSEPVKNIFYRGEDFIMAVPIFVPQLISRDSSFLTLRTDQDIVGILEIILSKPEVTMTEDNSNLQKELLKLQCAAQVCENYLSIYEPKYFDVSSIVENDKKLQPRIGAESPTKKKVRFIQAYDFLVINVQNTSLCNDGNIISEMVVSTMLGKLTLHSERIVLPEVVSPRSPSRTSKSQQDQIAARVQVNMMLGDIPHGSHIMLQYYAKGRLVLWAGMFLFDFAHKFQCGQHWLSLQPAHELQNATALEVSNCIRKASDNSNTTSNSGHGTAKISLEGTHDAVGIFAFGCGGSTSGRANSVSSRLEYFNNEDDAKAEGEKPEDIEEKKKQLETIKKDPLALLSVSLRAYIWSYRESLIKDAAFLPAFLLSVEWKKYDMVIEAYRLLHLWKQPTYLEALQLLGPLYADPKVRAYAVNCLHSLPDHRLRLYLLQLVQAVKNERHHDSALARFLLYRGLNNPAEVGYSLYWFLKTEAQYPQMRDRYQLIIDQYLELCGIYKLEIRQSMYVMKKLEQIASKIKQERSLKTRASLLEHELRECILPDAFQLPLHPRTFCVKYISEKCRVLDSKKKPLFLVLQNAKAQHNEPHIIFKSGDDLRQDQLVLQLLRVMDDIWQEAGMDMCLSPYSCIATGEGTGLIEVVQDAETLAQIVYNHRGKSFTSVGRKLVAAKDALMSEAVISHWLFRNTSISSPEAEKMRAMDVRPDPEPPMTGCFPLSSPRKKKDVKQITGKERDEITQNFMRSCAGYCVATYVLGIGDRHNDNLMLQRNGKLFHIDFGHFLGNFKSKLGVKRERAPFVFTPSMLEVLGGPQGPLFEEFQRIACEAFQVLRSHSNLLITLLILALNCRVPELQSEEDIRWIYKTLFLDESDESAEIKFKKLIRLALRTKTTLMNDAVHLMAH